MQNWLFPGNEQYFRLADYFTTHDVIDWTFRSKRNFDVGDFLFMYVASPIAEVKYAFQVQELNVPIEDQIDDSEYVLDASKINSDSEIVVRLQMIYKFPTKFLTLSKLNELGESVPQGAQRMKESTYNYINDALSSESFIPQETLRNPQLVEGTKQYIQSSRYERNPIARAQCIQKYGSTCQICGFDFEKTYGPIGKNFIHVHHIQPISEVGQLHRVDPEKDLIPVCPNCHAMLHHKVNGKCPSVEQLKSLISIKK